MSSAASMTLRPDWVMCGGPHPPGVRLLASRELTEVELRAEMDWLDPVDPWATFPGIPVARYFLTAQMRQFILIDAPDYPSAFKALFEKWSPEPGQRPALGMGQLQLPEAPGGGAPGNGLET